MYYLLHIKRHYKAKGKGKLQVEKENLQTIYRTSMHNIQTTQKTQFVKQTNPFLEKGKDLDSFLESRKLQNKGNYKQSEETAFRMGENNSK